jgi:hypothetical protein
VLKLCSIQVSGQILGGRAGAYRVFPRRCAGSRLVARRPLKPPLAGMSPLAQRVERSPSASLRPLWITCARATDSPSPSSTRLPDQFGDLPAIVARLEAKKVFLRVLSMSGTQALDTNTATVTLMLSVIGAVGQAEREAMLGRRRDR